MPGEGKARVAFLQHAGHGAEVGLRQGADALAAAAAFGVLGAPAAEVGDGGHVYGRRVVVAIVAPVQLCDEFLVLDAWGARCAGI